MPSPMPLIARSGGKLAGVAQVPGDVGLSLGALVLGALAVGRTSIKGLFEGAEARHLIAALRALGATITRHDDGLWSIDGVGVGGLMEPAEILALGDSELALYLLLGLAATHPLTAIFTGDAELNRRPLARLAQPLERVGAQFIGRRGGLLPLVAVGTTAPMPIDHRLVVASAEVKAALLMAGLNTPGITSVVEPRPTRDDTEHLLRRFGARVDVERLPDGGRRIRLEGQPELVPAALDLPGDPSAAAVPLVAALAQPGSDVTLSNVGLNPLRTDLLTLLKEMGAEIEILNPRTGGDGPAGDLRIRASRLKGVAVAAERAPGLVDDYPILAVAAAHATGATVLPGLHGDRLAALARGLASCGVPLTVEDDRLTVHGTGGPVPGGARIPGDEDPGLGLALLGLGLGATAPVTVEDAGAIDGRFPGFAGLMRGLGADLTGGAA